jgi:tetratricopeptide (TPR) repeat protein
LFYLKYLIVYLFIIMQVSFCSAESSGTDSTKAKNTISFNIDNLKTLKDCKKTGKKLYDAKQFFDAIQVYHKAINLDPKDAEAYNLLGKSYYSVNDYGKAEMFLKTAISIKENYEDAYYNLGNVYYAMGKLKEAMDNYKKAISINPAYINPKKFLKEMN